MEDHTLGPKKHAQTSNFLVSNVNTVVGQVHYNEGDNVRPRQYASLRSGKCQDNDESDEDSSDSDSVPALVTSSISSISTSESRASVDNGLLKDFQRSFGNLSLSENVSGEACRTVKRVRFDPNCRTSHIIDPDQRRRACCDEFMEQTITVHEIERIFDIDFKKDWVRLVTSYRPRIHGAVNEELLPPGQQQLRRKIEKAEKRMRKREEKILRYTKKAQSKEEEAVLRRAIIQKMSAKAKKYMDKRRAQWDRQDRKVYNYCVRC
ncbi:hypothetical protein BIW11_04379 [Tropilaelaps mercedesae]|uniref:Uncharacterized protein n=1 Tax=Tropilaelaps mercedesae TaxID=418985 RepID=A0A1V9X731_9ACAR|nr:hypothetical protein BIW11_04379 [Tropilaelaps mercedesae]